MLEIGSTAPAFSLRDKEGSLRSLGEFLGQKAIVLYFYPKNETPGCVKEACAFRDHYEAFTEAGAEVIGISADSTSSHQKFANNRRLPFVLLSDPDRTVHKQYQVSARLFGLLSGRVTYVIDPQGTIRNRFESQLNIQKHLSEALKTVQGLAAHAPPD